MGLERQLAFRPVRRIQFVLMDRFLQNAMCTGAILLYGIPRVVIGENVTFMGAEESLRAADVQLDVLQDDECIAMMRDFIANNPAVWNEDIGT